MDRIKKAMDLARAQRDAGAAASLSTRATVRRHELPRSPEPEPAMHLVDSSIARTPLRAVDADALRRNRLLSPVATGSVARAYKLLRTQVLQRMQQESYRSLAIVSAEEGEGRTTTAINLGIAIGEDADHTSLVVDLDLRRPGVAQAFGIMVQDGVDCCLRGEKDVADVLIAPQGYQSLTLLPAGNPVPQSSELLSSDRAGRVLAEVVRRYTNRIVLFDLPPLLATDDALALLPCAEAALVVVHEGKTRRQDLERALDLIGRVPVIGTVLHGSREPVATH